MRWLPRVALLLLLGCSPSTPAPTPAPTAPPPPPPPEPVASEPTMTAPLWSYTVVNRYPHDTTAYTQGLVVGPAGTLWESTGQNGHSELRQVELTTGKVLKRHKLGDQFFGEGLALWHKQLYQLTWQNQKGFRYDPATFKVLGEFGYIGEGWGLVATPDNRLVLSNGSADLSFRDPQTFREVSRVVVKDGTNPVMQLNELEWVEGRIYANVYMTPFIAVIEPKTGLVEAFLDLRGLLTRDEAQRADVLNGIAYDPATKRLFVTGKYWPRLFEIEVVKSL